jgi:hypothetical protein
MGEIVIDHLGVTLPEHLSVDLEGLSIVYRVSAKEDSAGPMTIAINQIARRD